MKRIRTLHHQTCSEILAARNESLQAVAESPSIEAYNNLVEQFEVEHGRQWCADRALIRMPAHFKFSVVMPVFNESQTILEMINRVCAVDLPLELIIVDDGSTDGTSEELKKLTEVATVRKSNAFGEIQIRTLLHEKNLGKGAALQTGFKAATGDVVGIQDADQEYNPQEFIVLISSILSDEADVVYGSRFARGNQTNSPKWHRLGNGLITWLSNRMTGLGTSDAETCYKLMRKSVLDQICSGLTEQRFGIELEMTAKLAKIKSIRFDERPISYDKRTYAEGKKIGIKDGFRALWCILKY